MWSVRDPRGSGLPNRETVKVQVGSIVAVVLGNALEFYDFTIYATFASILGRSFFPTKDPVIGLILAVSTLAYVRPLPGRATRPSA
jgi:hypothetical protein